MQLEVQIGAKKVAGKGKVYIKFSDEICGLRVSHDYAVTLALRIAESADTAERMVEPSPGLVLPARY